MSNIPNDFASLSADIIHDVLEFGHFQRFRQLDNFPNVPLGGRWGAIAEKFRYFRMDETSIEHRFYKVTSRRVEQEHLPLSDSRARNVSVNQTYVGENTDFTEMMHLAPNLYEHLCMCSPKPIPKQFLEALGTRFTTIVWTGTTPDAPHIDGELEFFTRQLQSPHLRSLHSDSPVFQTAELEELLVNFVGRRNFQSLCLPNKEVVVSGRVYQSAYNSWLDRKDRDHLRSSLTALITHEQLEQFTFSIRGFRWSTEQVGPLMKCSFAQRHQNADYQMAMFYETLRSEMSDVVELRMFLSSD